MAVAMETARPLPWALTKSAAPVQSADESHLMTPPRESIIDAAELRARLHEPSDGHSGRPLDPKALVALGSIRIVVSEPNKWPPETSSFQLPGRWNYDILFEKVSYLQDVRNLVTKVIKHRNAKDFSVRLYVPIKAFAEHRTPHLNVTKARRWVMPFVDKGEPAWLGIWTLDDHPEPYLPKDACVTDRNAKVESMFYIFNTLSSPQPNPDVIADQYKREGAEDILNNDILGLKTPLYPFQQESAAMMIQRECSPTHNLAIDCLLLQGPTGQKFYYNAKEGTWSLQPVTCPEPAGGVLAETMGYGKTIICLATILATRGCWAEIPEGREQAVTPGKRGMRSLFEICANTVRVKQIPWKNHFSILKSQGLYHENCIARLQKESWGYWDQRSFLAGQRRSIRVTQHPEFIRVSSATLIVVPPNLLRQWQQQIEKHTDNNHALDVLVLARESSTIPPAEVLLGFDVVLISRSRLDRESLADEGDERSPLRDIRWLRVILDEAVGYSSAFRHNGTAALLRKMHFDGRWIVTGALSNAFRDAEVRLNEYQPVDAVDQGGENASVLQDRTASPLLRERPDLGILKNLASEFLEWQPWLNNGESVSYLWRQHLLRGTTDQLHLSRTVRRLMEGIFVRHRYEDIHEKLPDLHYSVTSLEPSYYDKLNANIFSVLLTVNAVASERVDQDYMFDAANRRYLDRIITNFRNATFHWTHDANIVRAALKEARAYLESSTKTISGPDRALLERALDAGERAIQDQGWLSYSSTEDVGVFVEGIPTAVSEVWVPESTSPLLLVMQLVRAAQKHIRAQENEEDPAVGLAGAGLKALHASKAVSATRNPATPNRNGNASGKDTFQEIDQRNRKMAPNSLESPAKRSKGYDQARPASLPLSSELAKSSLVGFSSAKLSYLISQVLAHISTSKILIFYSGEHTGFWVAEALERVFVTSFRIYASKIAPKLRNQYLEQFQEDPSIRILLMEIRQASHGLNITAANRVYIIEPIWQPHIEAQAIKRAHRIGQTRPVYVETLVLRGTLEEKMLQRRKEMSSGEHRQAAKSLLDDTEMKKLVEEAAESFLEFTEEENRHMSARVARLENPRKLFVETDSMGEVERSSGADGSTEPAKKKVKMVQFSDDGH